MREDRGRGGGHVRRPRSPEKRGGSRGNPEAFRMLGNRLAGVIFLCNDKTLLECLERGLFGLPTSHQRYVSDVRPGMLVFLYDTTARHLHGVFEAASRGARHDPSAWGGRGAFFGAQVRVKRVEMCRPMHISQFCEAIAENYYSEDKFHQELDKGQVERLLILFHKGPEPPPRTPHPPDHPRLGPPSRRPQLPSSRQIGRPRSPLRREPDPARGRAFSASGSPHPPGRARSPHGSRPRLPSGRARSPPSPRRSSPPPTRSHKSEGKPDMRPRQKASRTMGPARSRSRGPDCNELEGRPSTRALRGEEHGSRGRAAGGQPSFLGDCTTQPVDRFEPAPTRGTKPSTDCAKKRDPATDRERHHDPMPMSAPKPKLGPLPPLAAGVGGGKVGRPASSTGPTSLQNGAAPAPSFTDDPPNGGFFPGSVVPKVVAIHPGGADVVVNGATVPLGGAGMADNVAGNAAASDGKFGGILPGGGNLAANGPSIAPPGAIPNGNVGNMPTGGADIIPNGARIPQGVAVLGGNVGNMPRGGPDFMPNGVGNPLGGGFLGGNVGNIPPGGTNIASSGADMPPGGALLGGNLGNIPPGSADSMPNGAGIPTGGALLGGTVGNIPPGSADIAPQVGIPPGGAFLGGNVSNVPPGYADIMPKGAGIPSGGAFLGSNVCNIPPGGADIVPNGTGIPPGGPNFDGAGIPPGDASLGGGVVNMPLGGASLAGNVGGIPPAVGGIPTSGSSVVNNSWDSARGPPPLGGLQAQPGMLTWQDMDASFRVAFGPMPTAGLPNPTGAIGGLPNAGSNGGMGAPFAPPAGGLMGAPADLAAAGTGPFGANVAGGPAPAPWLLPGQIGHDVGTLGSDGSNVAGTLGNSGGSVGGMVGNNCGNVGGMLGASGGGMGGMVCNNGEAVGGMVGRNGGNVAPAPWGLQHAVGAPGLQGHFNPVGELNALGTFSTEGCQPISGAAAPLQATAAVPQYPGQLRGSEDKLPVMLEAGVREGAKRKREGEAPWEGELPPFVPGVRGAHRDVNFLPHVAAGYLPGKRRDQDSPVDATTTVSGLLPVSGPPLGEAGAISCGAVSQGNGSIGRNPWQPGVGGTGGSGNVPTNVRDVVPQGGVQAGVLGMGGNIQHPLEAPKDGPLPAGLGGKSLLRSVEETGGGVGAAERTKLPLVEETKVTALPDIKGPEPGANEVEWLKQQLQSLVQDATPSPSSTPQPNKAAQPTSNPAPIHITALPQQGPFTHAAIQPQGAALAPTVRGRAAPPPDAGRLPTFNPAGFDPASLNPTSFNPSGPNSDGLNPPGFNSVGLNPSGFNPAGSHVAASGSLAAAPSSSSHMGGPSGVSHVPASFGGESQGLFHVSAAAMNGWQFQGAPGYLQQPQPGQQPLQGGVQPSKRDPRQRASDMQPQGAGSDGGRPAVPPRQTAQDDYLRLLDQ